MKLRIKSMIWNIRTQKNPTNQNKKKKESKKNEDSISSLLDNFKRSNIHNIGVPEEGKDQETGNLFEKIMKENFPNLVKEIDMQVHEVQSPPNKMDSRGPLQDTELLKGQKLKIRRDS